MTPLDNSIKCPECGCTEVRTKDQSLSHLYRYKCTDCGCLFKIKYSSLGNWFEVVEVITSEEQKRRVLPV